MTSTRTSVALAPFLLAVASCGSPDPADVDLTVQLPDGEPGIGLDDLRFSRTLRRLVVAGGRSGYVDLVDPETLEVTAIGGFTSSPDFDGGDLQGVESADEGRGLVFANDREKFQLLVIDPVKKALVATTQLEHTEPDYVRFLYVGCGNAAVVVLDLNQGGKEVGSYILGDGPSIIAYNPSLHHLYLRGDGHPEVAVLSVSKTGALARIGGFTTTAKGHCMAADDGDRLWICDWESGRLLGFRDDFAATP